MQTQQQQRGSALDQFLPEQPTRTTTKSLEQAVADAMRAARAAATSKPMAWLVWIGKE